MGTVSHTLLVSPYSRQMVTLRRSLSDHRVRVLIVDGDDIIRFALRHILNPEPDISIIDDLASGREALGAVCATRPDVVLIGTKLLDMSGADLTPQVLRTSSPTKVIMVALGETGEDGPETCHEGVAGYLSRGTRVMDVPAAVRAVAAGHTWGTSHSAEEALPVHARARGRAVDRLSPREREVIGLVASGFTSAQIGEILFISRRTVERHRANALLKLGIEGHADLIRRIVVAAVPQEWEGA